MKSNIKIIILKIISFIIIFFEALFFGLMPNYIDSCKTNQNCMGYASSFTGGLFLGISLIHILPESIEKYDEIPISSFFAFITFCFIFYIDKIKLSSKNHHHNSLLEENLLNKQINNLKEFENVKENINNIDNNDINYEQIINKNEHQTNQTNFLFLFALGFHAFFEGISLGASKEYKTLLTMLIGILADKWAEALSLGITFVKTNIKFKKYLTIIIIFSLISPFGILIGLLATLSESKIIEAIFLGITSGTFIYISICDVLIEEFIEEENDKNKSIKFLFFIIGGIFISLISVYEHFFENK
jgi:zinc transporter 1/2/3